MAVLGIIAFILLALVLNGYPQIAALIAGLLIFAFVKIIRHSNKEDFEKSQGAIGLAVEYIEEGYSIAKEITYLEPFLLTMYVLKTENSDDVGFQVVLYAHDVVFFSESVLKNHYGWKAERVDDITNLYIEFDRGIICDWNKFNKAVWDEIKEKHPDWDVDFIYNEKSVVHL